MRSGKLPFVPTKTLFALSDLPTPPAEPYPQVVLEAVGSAVMGLVFACEYQQDTDFDSDKPAVDKRGNPKPLFMVRMLVAAVQNGVVTNEAVPNPVEGLHTVTLCLRGSSAKQLIEQVRLACDGEINVGTILQWSYVDDRAFHDDSDRTYKVYTVTLQPVPAEDDEQWGYYLAQCVEAEQRYQLHCEQQKAAAVPVSPEPAVLDAAPLALDAGPQPMPLS